LDSLRDLFLLDPDVVFLNHGSFGACPRPVFETYQNWQKKLEYQPVKFINTELADEFASARNILGDYLNVRAENLVYIPNATFGVNVVARSLELQPGDEILTTDHEYGACDKTWEYICQKKGSKYIRQPIPLPADSPEQITDQFREGVSEKTKLIFISHITSPTALRFPIESICKRAREANILTLIDGAHAPGQIPLNLEAIGADFYTGNCHKWMMAPKGAAFLFTRTEIQHLIQPLIVSWGWGVDKLFTFGSDYLDYLQWWGTKDPSVYLTVPAALKFQTEYNWESVRKKCQMLCQQAISRIDEITHLPSMYTDLSNQYVQMGIALLPELNNSDAFKETLYKEYKIEIPIIDWGGKQFIRVSIQGYNTQSDVDTLISALKELLPV
jgi:isopenicillin-N epimerase